MLLFFWPVFLIIGGVVLIIMMPERFKELLKKDFKDMTPLEQYRFKKETNK